MRTRIILVANSFLLFVFAASANIRSHISSIEFNPDTVESMITEYAAEDTIYSSREYLERISLRQEYLRDNRAMPKVRDAHKKDKLTVSIGIPVVSHMYGTWDEGDLRTWGFLGIELGAGWNYAEQRSIRFTAGVTGLVPKLEHVNCDYPGPNYVWPDFDTHCAIPDQRRVYMAATHGHEFSYGTVAYGPSVNFVNIFNDDGQNVNHWSAGIYIMCGIRFNNLLVMGLSYNPTFLRMDDYKTLSYEHAFAVNLRFDLHLKRGNR